MTAPTLFDDWQTEAAATTRARVSDPVTSQIGAAMTPAEVARAELPVLLDLGRWGVRGATRDRVAHDTGGVPASVSSRFNGLARKGLAAKTGRIEVGDSGRPQEAWRLTDEGRKVYERLRAGE